MNPGQGSTADYSGDVLNALAIGLVADTSESGKKALEVVRARSPELPRLSEQTEIDRGFRHVGSAGLNRKCLSGFIPITID